MQQSPLVWCMQGMLPFNCATDMCSHTLLCWGHSVAMPDVTFCVTSNVRRVAGWCGSSASKWLSGMGKGEAAVGETHRDRLSDASSNWQPLAYLLSFCCPEVSCSVRSSP